MQVATQKKKRKKKLLLDKNCYWHFEWTYD